MYRLEIGAAIAHTQIVNTAELADELGISRQSVNQELRILERAGLLARAPSSPGSRKVFLIPAKSGYWFWCLEALSNASLMLKPEAPI